MKTVVSVPAIRIPIRQLLYILDNIGIYFFLPTINRIFVIPTTTNMKTLAEKAIEGKRIKMISMDDPDPILEGEMGTIIKLDGAGQIQVKWDNGRSLSVIPEEDQFEIED